MSSENARCLPEATGLAAEVNQLLQQYSKPQSEPQRYPVPTEPGVYKLDQPGMEDLFEDEMAQLTETGQWWPYPFVFSGWRESEISLFKTTPLPHLTMDVPEIPNPEEAEAITVLTDELLEAFPSLERGAVVEYARGKVAESFH